MGHQAQGLGEQRLHTSCVRVGLDLGVPGQRTDPAPPVAGSGSVVMVASSVSPLMSTSTVGAASRIDSSGTRLCPPASTFASGCAARASTASATEAGRTYSNGAGFTQGSSRLGHDPREPW